MAEPQEARIPELGRVLAPYGGAMRCANIDCPHPDEVPSLDEYGAYMYRDLDTNKLVIFCGDCARHAELNAGDRFKLVAL
jgi:hypothetical protein